MSNIDFSKIATTYEKTSTVQKSAADVLLTLLKIGNDDDVLDVGCGTGTLTRKIRTLTQGNLVGVDSSIGMVEEARQKSRGMDITFRISPAEELSYKSEFDIVFCNSAFQWFKDTERAVANFYEALTKGGRVGIQAPAKKEYCPNFVHAVEKAKSEPKLKDTYAHFRNPWFFLETSDDYRKLFEKQGFKMIFCTIESVNTIHNSEEVFNIFSSGAIAGYLNQNFYDVRINDNYIETFSDLMREEFRKQENSDGQVELIFNRIMLVAVKE